MAFVDFDKLHVSYFREAIVIAELEGAGFVFGGESNELANPEDDHTKGVFDPEIRGRTDRYVMRFRKPE